MNEDRLRSTSIISLLLSFDIVDVVVLVMVSTNAFEVDADDDGDVDLIVSLFCVEIGIEAVVLDIDYENIG